jgi:hypothetical protein
MDKKFPTFTAIESVLVAVSTKDVTWPFSRSVQSTHVLV